MDMSQYRELFLSETREHINNLSQLVITLEQTPDNRETIDALFREAHSIKGMAATMGFDRTASLSHHLEDLLDGFRSTGKVPGAAIDLLLSGIDLLDGLLDDLNSGRPEREIDAFIMDEGITEEPILIAEELVEAQDEPLMAIAIEETSEGFRAAEEPRSESEALSQIEIIADPPAEMAPPESAGTFQVLVDLAEDTPASAARGILILRELKNSGELLSSQPDIAALRGGEECLQIKAWLQTSLSKRHIEKALTQISGVARVRFAEDRRKDESRGNEKEHRTIRVRTELLDQFVNLTGELITHRHMLNAATTGRDWEELTQTLGQTGRLLDDLHHHVLQARLMPLENITGRLPRIVRELSRKSDKKVTLKLDGAEVGIDRAILQELTDPLVHLVRNAVDHGIEQKGTITVSARRERGLVLVEVADDGKGMDPAGLRQKAIERKLLSPEQAAGLSDHDALMLICQAGFSTAAEITETSGRGVGMDVVKAAINNLGGTLDIFSAPGEGTRFQMWLPLSVAIIKILQINCAGKPLAIPVTRAEKALDLPTIDIRASGQNREFLFEEEMVPLYLLTEALGLPEVPAGETTWVVLVKIQGRLVGLQVDRFLGQREAFVKNLGFPMNLLTGLSGATVEGDGQVVFIIDPQSLFEDRVFS